MIKATRAIVGRAVYLELMPNKLVYLASPIRYIYYFPNNQRSLGGGRQLP